MAGIVRNICYSEKTQTNFWALIQVYNSDCLAITRSPANDTHGKYNSVIVQ